MRWPKKPKHKLVNISREVKRQRERERERQSKGGNERSRARGGKPTHLALGLHLAANEEDADTLPMN